MGTPGFAVPCLSALNQSEIEVVAVITSPDRPSGRGRKLQASEIKQFALDNGLKIMQPTNLKDPAFINDLKSLKADLFVVVAFRMLPKVVWDMPAKGTINLHGSLLPDYRGAAPINWAIINGDTKTGLSTFFINEDIDTGSIIDHKEVSIEDEDNMGTLHDKMSELGATLLLNTVLNIFKHKVSALAQIKKEFHKEAPKLNSDNTKIDFNQTAEKVHNLVRGLSPYPGAYSYLEHEGDKLKVKFFKTSLDLEGHSKSPGTIEIEGRDGMFISCGQGRLRVLELQIQGKKRMKTKDLLNGFKLENTAHFL